MRILHVASDGDDTNPGTRELPWATITRVQIAVDQGEVGRGDKVLFAI